MKKDSENDDKLLKELKFVAAYPFQQLLSKVFFKFWIFLDNNTEDLKIYFNLLWLLSSYM